MAKVSLTIVPQGIITITLVELADATIPVYGIKRDSDGVVIVSGNTTVTTNVGNTWTYETPLLDPLIDYTAAFRVTFSDTHIEYAYAHIQGIKSQTTLRALRRELAIAIGDNEIVNTSSTAPDSASTVVSTMINRDAKESAYDFAFVYACNGGNAGQQRKVSQGSFISTNGQLGYVQDWTAQMTANIELEVHQKMGAVSSGKMIGYRECINQALNILWTIDMITFPSDSTDPVSGLTRDLNTFDWLRQQSQIIGVKDVTGYAPGIWLPTDMYQFQYDAERPILSGPQPIDPTLYSIAAYRPLNTWIKRGGVWGETIGGLVDDTDECLGDHVLITQVALYFVYKAMAENPYESASARDRWEMKAARQALIAKNIKLQNLPKSAMTTTYKRLPTPGYKGLLGW